MTAVPYRWDLVTPDQLGTLLDDNYEPSLFFVEELATCTGKVLARSEAGALVFVGRSLDSMYDLLSGALSGVADAPTLSRVPISFSREWRGEGQRLLTPAEVKVARTLLASAGVTPQLLARRTTPISFVDVVYSGGTFGELFKLLKTWTEDEREPWAVVRKKVRFIGVTERAKTSPNTSRWQQRHEWPKELPKSAVLSVSVSWTTWDYLGNMQYKLTRSHAPRDWFADEAKPADRGFQTRFALAEAVALVAHGRSKEARQAISAAMAGEPGLKQAAVRTLRSALLK